MTKFILYKQNMSTSTRDIKAVAKLKSLGWEIKHNTLSELI